MSYIENRRGRDGIYSVELWDRDDVAEYCNVPLEKAGDLIVLARRHDTLHYNGGYGDIEKEHFLEFYNEVEGAKESARLQDEANAAAIVLGQKSLRLNIFSTAINATINLLKP